ncbi:MAG: hypothetical protein WA117_20175 [Verrucomicrobiia bacterium]
MTKTPPDKHDLLEAIKRVAQDLGRTPTFAEFEASTGISDYFVNRHFSGWRDAARAAGFVPDTTNVKLSDDVLLRDWGEIVRKHRHIPTRDQYRREGNYSLSPFEDHFGPWSDIPNKFRDFAQGHPEWADVVALLPEPQTKFVTPSAAEIDTTFDSGSIAKKHKKLDGRPTYGNPIDFRGLRHEPVNEQGVVFLFGMIAKEMGYMVEAVQTGYPDCEAKRQVAPDKWQRVRIEFEFESRNFDHPPDGCDVIVCWRHNWPDCPARIEVVELCNVLKSLARSND